MAAGHIHIGAGLLGLGLVCEYSKDSNLDLVILNRKHFKSESRIRQLQTDGLYYIQKEFNGTPREYKPIDHFTLTTYDGSSPSDEILNLFCERKLRLITTSVTSSGLPDTATLIASAIRERESARLKTPLFIIACENIPQNSHALKKAVEKHVEVPPQYVFCNNIVDRACVRYCSHEAKLAIATEPYRLWTIEENELTGQLKELLATDDIEFVESIRPYEKRKAWCVNGTHLAVALLARYLDRPVDFLNHALEDSTVMFVINKIHEEMCSTLVSAHYLIEDEVKQFCTQVLRRVEGSRDESRRILKDILMDRDRIDTLAKDLFVDLVRRSGVEAYKSSMERAVFTFVDKLKERLAEPAEESFITTGLHRPWLLMLLCKAIYLIAKEGARLRDHEA